MLEAGFTFLIYAITREIGRRYTSQTFALLQRVCIVAAGCSLVSIALQIAHMSASIAFETGAILIMWAGVLHLWGLPWNRLMMMGVSAGAIVVGGVSLFLHHIAGSVLGVFFFFAITGLAYVRKGKSSVPIPSAAALFVCLLGDLIAPSLQWRFWEALAVLFALVTRLITYLHAIYHQSITDKLTGLYNRATFLQYVDDFLRSGRTLGVIFLDIDNFKKLNDTEGHTAGDQALIKVAGVLKQRVKGIGVAARYGGEEMVAVIVDRDPVEIAESIRTQLPIDAGVTASIGVVRSVQGVDPQMLVDQADHAMYHAKRGGKNRIVRAEDLIVREGAEIV